MLEFVHLTGAEAGKDLQTRRKVRSQAMRDFRRRQREEREAANKKGTVASSDRSNTRTSLQWQGRARSASSSSTVFAVERQRTSSTVSSAKLGSRYGYETTVDSSLSVPAVHNPSVTLYGDYPTYEAAGSPYFEPTPILKSQPESLSPSPNMLPQTVHAIPRNPSNGAMDTKDPFQSPAQMEQMFSFCKSYCQWLQPGIDVGHTSTVLENAWRDSTCPMLLAACCLASVGHLDAIQPNRPGGQYEFYKARVLREVSTRMRSPDTATSNETIGALGLLTSFEMSRGSEEALTHLRGLRSIMAMKGGAEAVSSAGLLRMLETLDLLHAAMFEQPLVFTTAKGPPSAAYAESGLPDAEIFARLMPLLAAEQEQFLKTAEPVLTSKLESLRRLISDAATASKDAMADDFIANCLGRDPDFAAQWNSHLEDFYVQSYQDDPEARDAQYLARACHACMTLFHNTIQGLSPRVASNQTHVDSIWIAVRAINDTTWRPLPYLRLLILLRALVSSRDISRRSYFKANLVRAIYQTGSREWKRVKNFIMKYLHMTRVLEQPMKRPPTPPAARAQVEMYLTPTWRGRNGSTYSASTTPLSRAATVSLPTTAIVPSNSTWSPSPMHITQSLPGSHLNTPYQLDQEDPFIHQFNG